MIIQPAKGGDFSTGLDTRQRLLSELPSEREADSKQSSPPVAVAMTTTYGRSNTQSSI